MVRHIKSVLIVWLLLILVCGVEARENVERSGKTRKQTDELKAQAANCSPASAQTDLDVNNVRTTLLNGGDMWWDLNDAKYEVPKVPTSSDQPSVHSLFAGSIWIGGIDPGGNLKIAAQTYRQSGNDYWPGPLDQNASVTSQTCNNYDRFWKVSGNEIDKLIAASDNGSSSVPQSDISSNILEWPAKGNTNAKGTQGTTINVTDDMAPFEDVDGDGQYDPTQGDYPIINEGCSGVYADQMIFWVFNDKGNIHTETGGQAIGLEIQTTAFAFNTSDAVNNMTFYRYQITNESSSRLNDAYMGQWVDPDLGNFQDDFVGCDTSRDLGIVYNGDPIDEDAGTKGYGENPPLLGVDYFEGPNTADGDELGMSSFLYYNNDFSVTGNPETAVHYYNYLSGFWKDGSPFTFGGNGYGGSEPFPYMFPGDPGNNNEWSECSEGNTPADRRFLQSSGPFTLEPGAVNDITIGVTWVRPPNQSGCEADFDALRRADDKAQSLFDNCFDLIDRPDAPSLQVREMDEELVIKLFNEPSSNNYKEQYESVDPDAALAAQFDSVDYDTTYNFQGYKLYQLRDAQVSADDLDDPSKARLVAQVDIEDDIDRIVNWERDASLEAFVPEVKVDGNNEGIRHTFRVTEDRFAEENQRLVNHKTYYFAAIAYAHNNYKEFNYDTDNFADPVGQDQAYLKSSSNFQVYSAIPHIPKSGRGGTKVNAEYGDGVKITRIEGQGNGGLNLDLTDESINNILSSDDNAYDEITYKKNRGPVQVKVVDPLAVKDTDFSLYLDDDSTNFADSLNNTELSANARWYLVDETRNDTVWSNRDISRANEQPAFLTNESGDILRDYGISINIEQVDDPGTLEDEPPFNPVDKNNGVIDASIEFQNPQNQWLSGIQDDDGADYFNWIRSGSSKECENTQGCANDNMNNDQKGFYDDYYKVFNYGGFTDSVRYRDPNEDFEDLVDGTVAPYALAANFMQDKCLNSGQRPGRCAAQDPPHYTNGPAFPRTYYSKGDTISLPGRLRAYQSESKWNNYIPKNNLTELNSVDVVLTDDKSKWTRAPVLELGERDEFTEGNVQKGQLRMHPSIDSSGELQSPLNPATLDKGREYVYIGDGGSRITVYEIGGTNPTTYASGEIFSLSFDTDTFKTVGKGDIYDVSDVGMGYFPGYAINLETGERLNIMFGEASTKGDDNGNDMIWNPTSTLQSSIPSQSKTTTFGGKHHIYVHNSRYDGGESIRDTLREYQSQDEFMPKPIRKIHDSIMWVSMPILNPDSELKSYEEGLIPNKAKISLRVNKPYEKYALDGSNNGLPQYEFSTEGLGVDTGRKELAKEALDMIKVVPNPYYAFSNYERSQIDNEVKITNLPANATVTIYSINGDLIRRYERDVAPDTSPGSSTDKQNFDNTLSWDLNNFKNVPISSGVYLIHIQADGIGERVVKFFGVMRPIDLDAF